MNKNIEPWSILNLLNLSSLFLVYQYSTLVTTLYLTQMEVASIKKTKQKKNKESDGYFAISFNKSLHICAKALKHPGKARDNFQLYYQGGKQMETQAYSITLFAVRSELAETPVIANLIQSFGNWSGNMMKRDEYQDASSFLICDTCTFTVI